MLQYCQLCLNFIFLFLYIVLHNAFHKLFLFGIVGAHPTFVKYKVAYIFQNFHLIKKKYTDRLHILSWIPSLSKPASKLTNKTCFECITLHKRITERNKTLSEQCQKKILSGNEEYMLSGANLITWKKIQMGEDFFPDFELTSLEYLPIKYFYAFDGMISPRQAPWNLTWLT